MNPGLGTPFLPALSPTSPSMALDPGRELRGHLPIDLSEPQANRGGQVRGLPVLTLPAAEHAGKASCSQNVDILNQKGGLATCIFTNVLFV